MSPSAAAGVKALPHLLLVILILLIVGGLVGRGLWQRFHRQRRLRDVGRRFELNYSPVDLLNLKERYHNLSLLHRGHNRHICHILYGSNPAGLVALFRFSCELGLGLQRSNPQWWMTIVEMESHQPTWQAWPTESTYRRPIPSRSIQTRLGTYQLVAERAETLPHLRHADLASIFENAPPQCLWEARGPFLAVACPGTACEKDPTHLLETALAAAGRLATGP
jgi:hypothetical protein